MIADARLAALLFPGMPVEVACARDGEGDGEGDEAEAELLPAERALVDGAVPARVRTFALGRRAAHRALARIGAPATPILAGADRAPRWPAGFTGSIAHCQGIAIAAVVRTRDVQGIGVDVEVAHDLPVELWSRVLTAGEHATLAALPAGERGAFALRVFSAKEAVYKGWSPHGRRVLEFAEVEVGVFTRTHAASSSWANVLTPPRARACLRVTDDGVCVFAAAVVEFGEFGA